MIWIILLIYVLGFMLTHAMISFYTNWKCEDEIYLEHFIMPQNYGYGFFMDIKEIGIWICDGFWIMSLPVFLVIIGWNLLMHFTIKSEWFKQMNKKPLYKKSNDN